MRRRTNRRLFLVALILGLAGFTAVWYAASRDAGSGDPEFGGIYVEGMTGVPARVNPLFAGLNAADQSLVSLVFAGLTRLDGQGRAFPDLAETWVASEDARVYTFTLRPGLVWQDGVPLTAEDVQFTYQLLQTPSLRASPTLPEALASATVVAVDSRTVRFSLAEPFAPLPSYLTTGILPFHLLRDTPSEAMDVALFNLRPVGAGPYRLAELTPQRAVLEANSAYHAGQPFISRLELRFFANTQDLLGALGRNELDGAYFTTGLSETEQLSLERNAALSSRMLSSGDLTYIYFNLEDPLFEDRRVRQALLHGIDRDALAGLVYGGMAQRADSPLPNGIWSEADALSRYSPDVRTAELLLDEAGWRRGSNGQRQRNGATLSFTLTTNPDPVQVEVANMAAAQWQQIGVSVTVSVKGSTELVRDILAKRSFDALLFEQPAAADPDPYATWHSSQAGSGGLNLAFLESDRIDQVLVAGRAATQQEKRQELYGQFQELFAQEVPSLPLYSSSVLYIQRKVVKDAQPGLVARPGDRFWQVYQWYMRIK